MTTYNQLQLREIFHLQFLKNFSRKINHKHYALKGGTNLRFFFGSCRYSEDMDLDISGVRVDTLKTAVMDILCAPSFIDSLRTFGIQQVVPPNISKAKQTETTQRFKIHLLTVAGEDLFTKVEFSRRGYKEGIEVQPVSDEILRTYKMPPLIISHYEINSALWQKVGALAERTTIQARDLFDLHILIPQYQKKAAKHITACDIKTISKAIENIYSIIYNQFRDTVLAYLSQEDAMRYSLESVWDEIKLKTVEFLENWGKKNG